MLIEGWNAIRPKEILSFSVLLIVMNSLYNCLTCHSKAFHTGEISNWGNCYLLLLYGPFENLILIGQFQQAIVCNFFQYIRQMVCFTYHCKVYWATATDHIINISSKIIFQSIFCVRLVTFLESICAISGKIHSKLIIIVKYRKSPVWSFFEKSYISNILRLRLLRMSQCLIASLHLTHYYSRCGAMFVSDVTHKCDSCWL